MEYVVNVEVVVQKGDRFLLTRRSLNEEVAPGMLSFPGGKVEGLARETDILEYTATRELMEETGIEITDIRYAASKLFVTPRGQAVVDLIFTAKHLAGKACVQDPEELDAVFWLTREELLAQEDLPQWARDAFSAALKVLD